MMFDKTVIATIAEATQHDAAPETNNTNDNQTNTLTTAPTTNSDQHQKIMFIDDNVQNHAQLITDINKNTEVVLLDGTKNELEQITSLS